MRSHPHLTVLLLLTTAGCGGSSAGFAPAEDAAPAAQVLQGAVHLSGIVQGPAPVISADMVADALGSITGSAVLNNSEVVATAPLDAVYSSWPDGTLQCSSDVTGIGLGAVTSDEAVAALRVVSRPLGTREGIEVLLQRDPAVVAAGLVGSYRYATIILDPPEALDPLAEARFMSSGGLLVFAADGTAELIPDFLSVDGVHTPTETEPALWTLGPDGVLEVEFGSAILRGGVTRGGEILSLAGGHATGDQALALYAIREGTGHTSASFRGPYTTAHHDADGASGIGFLGRLRTDGAGGAELQLVEGPSFMSGRAFTYSVAPDGALELLLMGSGGSIPYVGALSQAGDLAVLVGGALDGAPPSLMVLVRPQASAVSTNIAPDVLQSAVLTAPTYFLAVPLQPLAVRAEFRVGEAGTVAPLGEPLPTKRTALRFPLTGVPPGAQVASARLYTEQTAVSGLPYTSPLGSLGEVVVDHADFGISLTIGDFDGRCFPLCRLGALSDTALLGARWLDVTEAVRADVAAGRTSSDFLLYFDGRINNSSGEIDEAIFDVPAVPGPNLGPRTRLYITYE